MLSAEELPVEELVSSEPFDDSSVSAESPSESDDSSSSLSLEEPFIPVSPSVSSVSSHSNGESPIISGLISSSSSP